jgi:predicted nucleic-acid-binding protein
MKAVDTNVLARYLRDDDPEQSRKAARLIQRVMNSGESLFVDHVVLCELAWILDSVYGHSKVEIIQMIEMILHTEQMQLEDRTCVEQALQDYRKSKAGFADCLVGRRNATFGCESTISFDRDLRSLETFQVM